MLGEQSPPELQAPVLKLVHFMKVSRQQKSSLFNKWEQQIPTDKERIYTHTAYKWKLLKMDQTLQI